MPSIALNSSLKNFSQLLENKFKTKNVEQQYRLLDQLDWSEIANAVTEIFFHFLAQPKRQVAIDLSFRQYMINFSFIPECYTIFINNFYQCPFLTLVVSVFTWQP